MKKPNLTIKIIGGSSIEGPDLIQGITDFMKSKGIGEIKVIGQREDQVYGWDGFTSEESIEIDVTDLKYAS